jgi:hypothetical protein
VVGGVVVVGVVGVVGGVVVVGVVGVVAGGVVVVGVVGVPGSTPPDDARRSASALRMKRCSRGSSTLGGRPKGSSAQTSCMVPALKTFAPDAAV